MKLRLSAIKKSMYNYRYIYFMMIPGIIFFLIFSYLPMYGITLAFKDFMYNKGISGSPWVGTKYFSQLFDDPNFWRVFLNTITISLGRLIFEFPIPIIFAILLNELRVKWFKKTIQSIMYFPYFLSWIVMFSILSNVFSMQTGLLNNILSNFGFEKINFLVSPKYFRSIIYFSDAWKMSGYTTILYLAAISNIDESLYEAAYADGASRFSRIWHITLPMMSPIILTVFILVIGNTMGGVSMGSNTQFDQIFNIYNELVYEVADIFDTYIYREGILRGQFSLTTAVGFIKAIINLFLLLLINKVSRKLTGSGLYNT